MFVNRVEAGRRLVERLGHLRGLDIVVLGLPRGGVPVAAEVAERLGTPLDVILVRKIGVPFQPELGLGAIGEDGTRVINEDIVRLAGVSVADIARVEEHERDELDRRARLYRGVRPLEPLDGRVALVIDDGLATGSTARVACQIARARGATRVVFAVPVAPADCIEALGGTADECVCVETHEPFHAIGQWYRDFSQVPDRQVVACLDRLAGHPHRIAPVTGSGAAGDAADPRCRTIDEEVEIVAGSAHLTGHLRVPPDARGLVIFAHGSGSSRHSPRNRYVADVLDRADIATLLFDLLTEAEEADRGNVFDVEMLGRRLVAVTEAARRRPDVGDLAIGYFGASTGAAAALWAAAEPSNRVAAVVSRGGRADLAGERLPMVRTPTLLIVGGDDAVVLDLNRHALRQLATAGRLEVVPGAGHLFEESGTLARAAHLARDWFVQHFEG